MKYFNPDISQWRQHRGVKLEGRYGNELASDKKYKKKP